ncbi:MAG: hypothetical protein IJU32_04835, partial [Pyramidobacter sp.]|nr:hypothetical protein [Pyramidobacter sp.]
MYSSHWHTDKYHIFPLKRLKGENGHETSRHQIFPHSAGGRKQTSAVPASRIACALLLSVCLTGAYGLSAAWGAPDGDGGIIQGNSVTASGTGSSAWGHYAKVTGENATAFGWYAEAQGENSLSFGRNTFAIGAGATAFGSNTSARADYSTTFGLNTKAEGKAATAFGQGSEASAYGATAWGGYIIGTEEHPG